MPQDLLNWVKVDAQPKSFEFRDDLKAGWDVCNETMLGSPEIGNASPSSGLNYLELGLPYKVPHEKMYEEAHLDGHHVSVELMNHGIYAKETHRTTIRLAPALTINEHQINNLLNGVRQVVKML